MGITITELRWGDTSAQVYGHFADGSHVPTYWRVDAAGLCTVLSILGGTESLAKGESRAFPAGKYSLSIAKDYDTLQYNVMLCGTLLDADSLFAAARPPAVVVEPGQVWKLSDGVLRIVFAVEGDMIHYINTTTGAFKHILPWAEFVDQGTL